MAGRRVKLFSSDHGRQVTGWRLGAHNDAFYLLQVFFRIERIKPTFSWLALNASRTAGVILKSTAQPASLRVCRNAEPLALNMPLQIGFRQFSVIIKPFCPPAGPVRPISLISWRTGWRLGSVQPKRPCAAALYIGRGKPVFDRPAFGQSAVAGPCGTWFNIMIGVDRLGRS